MTKNKYQHLAGLDRTTSVQAKLGLPTKAGKSSATKLSLKLLKTRKVKMNAAKNAQTPPTAKKIILKENKPETNPRSIKKLGVKKHKPKEASTAEATKSSDVVDNDGDNDTLRPLRHRKRQHRGTKRKTDPDSVKESVPVVKKKRGRKKPKVKQTDTSSDTEPGSSTEAVKVQKENTKPSLKSKLTEKLKGAKFRFINEKLYSIDSREALSLFEQDSSLFDVYHDGYRSQAAKWPANPLDLIIAQIKRKPKTIVIADLGCGDAVLAQSVHQTVHSFDLVAANERVTACDMAKLPMQDESVDMCVFCLALMGTNLTDFIMEAHRILKMGGSLKIAEIISRFFSTQNFRRAIQKMGFEFVKKKSINDYFILFEFTKSSEPANRKPAGLALRPCMYKKR